MSWKSRARRVQNRVVQEVSPSVRRRQKEARMSLTEDQIDLSYRAILGRAPRSAEQEQALRTQVPLVTLRTALMRSLEFRQKYDNIRREQVARLPKTLIHVHNPKCGGSSLSAILHKHFPGKQCLAVDQNTITRLTGMDLQARQQLRFIHGHLNYGVGDNLVQNCHYVSVLRKPGERIYSYCRYVARREDHPLYKVVNGQNMSFGDFLEFAEQKPGQRVELDNGQMRRLSGMASLKDVGKALAHIFAPDMTFGLMEHFDELLERLVAKEIIPSYEPTFANVAPKGSRYEDAVAQLTPAQSEVLAGFTLWDNRLYRTCYEFLFNSDPQMEQNS